VFLTKGNEANEGGSLGGFIISGGSRTPSAIVWKTAESTENAERFPVIFYLRALCFCVKVLRFLSRGEDISLTKGDKGDRLPAFPF